MNITTFENEIVEIDDYQSTYIILKFEAQTFRFNLSDKKEFRLKKGTSGLLKIFESHPLLINHNENIVTTYINSNPDNVDAFITDFENSINEITKGWRNWTEYVEDKGIGFTVGTFLNNVKNGRGKLMEAPYSITQKAIKVCQKHNVATKSFGNELKKDNLKLLMIGENYVIAREFNFYESF